ncbi:arrestin domain-containing protein 2-like [Condylostylus longicornis]|uniref:arrestin domain-containing protein 2-like n=1 Tax=Condylostylus longicornis TaxID=2530218 RepID=UPI00244E10D1|nr:arrestin domain-containing protein 2-like [Condylostylus longicornis]
MGTKCHITFDNSPEGTFYSGSIITGKVEIILDKKTSVRGIAIKFFGRASTLWIEGTGNDATERSGQIDYLSSTTYLIGSDSGSTIVIEPGIHTYNFSCALPSQLPSSFEGTHGNIRYSVQIIFDRPWKFDKTYTVGITILKMVDLNNNDSPSIRMPCEYQTSEKFWCGPCITNPLDIKLKIPQLGYVPGQAIIVNADIQNNTKLNIDHVQMSLIKTIKYYSDDSSNATKKETLTIVEIKTDEVKPKISKIFQEFVRIPAIPPTCTNLCKIIHITYDLHIKVKIHGFHTSPIIKFPITIGNIPLADVITQQPLSTISRSINQNNTNTVPVIDNIPVDSIATIAQDCHISPPSYQQAVYMSKVNLAKNEEHPICESPEYVPRYPVYNFSPIAPSLDEIDSPKYETNGIWI